METKYIFMTGGVVSGLGKGITAASLGRLLKARGYKVTIQKLDPYINIDPGTMSPSQHGEVYVTEDGAETDLDLGHYERFIDENLTASHNVTTGKIYWNVLNKERAGEYGGATIQVIPHITNEIKEYIYRAGRDSLSDIVISEIGGTVGDIEGLPFFEAIRQTAHDKGRENVMYVHVTLIPCLSFAGGELKTKPTQHSVKELLSLGIKPDALVCRTEHEINDEIRHKLSMFCNVDPSCIIQNFNADSIYDVPIELEKERFADIVCKRLGLDPVPPDLSDWEALLTRRKNIKQSVTVGIAGRHMESADAYLSVSEALHHAGISHDSHVLIKRISSDGPGGAINGGANPLTDKLNGIIVSGGPGERDAEGMIDAVRYARINKIPFLGINLGMQCAVIEFARHVLELPEADSIELNPSTTAPVIEIIPAPYDAGKRYDEMRLGARPCKLIKKGIASEAYGEELIYERHRHRFRICNQYINKLAEKGLTVTGLSPNSQRVEIIELTREQHPWFVAVQFHPEFKSRLTKPSPLFASFVHACLKHRG